MARANFTAELLQKKQAQGGGNAGSQVSGQLNSGHLPGQANSKIVSDTLARYRVNLPVMPVGKDGTGTAPWDEYQDYPVQQKAWLTYDPAKDSGITNNPDRSAEIPKHAPANSSKGTLASLKNPLFQPPKEKKEAAGSEIDRVRKMLPSYARLLGPEARDVSELRLAVAHELEMARGGVNPLSHAQVMDLLQFLDKTAPGNYRQKHATIDIPEADMEMLIEHYDGMTPEDIAAETSELFADAQLFHNWILEHAKNVHEASSDEGFGIRWQEFDKNDRAVTKERFFKSEELREGFANKVETKDNFKSFEAWSDPKIAAAASIRWVLKALQAGNELIKTRSSVNGILKDDEGVQKLIPEEMLIELVKNGTVALKETDQHGHDHYALNQQSVQAKKAADPLRLMVPEGDAQNVAMALAKSGIDEFEVEPEGGLCYFVFPNADLRNAAGKIISHAFASQINAQKGFWGFWAGNPSDLTEVPSTGAQPQKFVSSLSGIHGKIKLDAAMLQKNSTELLVAPPENAYYKVTQPFQVMLEGESEPTNSWYGASQVYQAKQVPTQVQAGDELHCLVGGTFLLRNGAVVGEVTSNHRKGMFEKSYGDTRSRFTVPEQGITPMDRQEATQVPKGGYRKKAVYNSKGEKVQVTVPPKEPKDPQGEIVQESCPLCGHKPVWKESPTSGSRFAYYCHACSRGFDAPVKTAATSEDDYWKAAKEVWNIIPEGTERGNHESYVEDWCTAMNNSPEPTKYDPDILNDYVIKLYERHERNTALKPQVMQLLLAKPMTTGEIEKALGGNKHSMNTIGALKMLKDEGLIKEKQMRWYPVSK